MANPKKYQFRNNNSEQYFTSKNNFINLCQARYNDCINSRKKFNYYFSYDYGKNWYHIENFKSLRQSIQNEKNVYASHGNSSGNKKSNHDEEQAKATEGLSIIDVLGIIILLWIGLTIYNKQFGRINFINNINGHLFGWNSSFVRKGSLKEKLNEINNTATSNFSEDEYAIGIDSTDSPSTVNQEDDEITEAPEPPSSSSDNSIDPNISIRIDTNKIINRFKFEDYYIKRIKIILSDTESDPENKNGTYCDDQELTCKYCSNKFLMTKNYISIKNTLSNIFFNPFYAWGIVMKYSFSETLQNQFRNEVNDYCDLYFSGNRYICELTEAVKEFCSIRCEDEYKWRH